MLETTVKFNKEYFEFGVFIILFISEILCWYGVFMFNKGKRSSIIMPDLSGEFVGGDWIVIPWSVAFWQHYI